MKNASRLVKIDLDERKEVTIDHINEDGEECLGDTVDLIAWAARDVNHIDAKVWSTVLKEHYLIDADELLKGSPITRENVLKLIDMPAQKQKIINHLNANYEKDLDTTVTTLVAAVAKRDLLGVKTQSALISVKFSIEMEEVLTPTELYIATGLMMGQL